MFTPNKVLQVKTFNFIYLFIVTFFVIGLLWMLFIALTHFGCCFPLIGKEKFWDLGFFSVSIFGFIVFLTMAPFQAAESKLSPGFLTQIFNTPSSHFGLSVLLISAITSFLIETLTKITYVEKFLNELYMALLATIVLAIVFHRFWVLYSVYQPFIVYKNIKKLKWEESSEETWMELFECTHKAIKQGRIGDALNFINLISSIPDISKNLTAGRQEDLANLHTIAADSRPVARLMEKKWPFLAKESTIPSLDNHNSAETTNDLTKG